MSTETIVKKNFNVNGKQFFLTWPRTDVTCESVLKFFTDKYDDDTIGGIAVCKEAHSNLSGIGTQGFELDPSGDEVCPNHIHAVIRFTRKIHFTNAREWDLGERHCNIQRCRHLGASIKYIKKDFLDYADAGTFDLKEDLWEHFENLKSELQVMEKCAELRCIHHTNYWSRRWKLYKMTLTESAPIRGLDEFTVPVAVNDWILNHDNKSLILIGPSGLGKTSLARSVADTLGDFLWCPERQALSAYGGENCIVFDDLDLHSVARTTVLNFIDIEQCRSFRVLYGSVAVSAGVRRIFSSNSLADLFGDKCFLPEVQRRITVVDVGELRRGEPGQPLRRAEELPAHVPGFSP